MLLRSTPRSQGPIVGGIFQVFFLSAVVVLVAGIAGARDRSRDYATETWVTDEGLPHNVVNRIRQDADGYMWLGTSAGLTRYDGFEFETFPLPSALTQGGGFNIRDLAITGRNTLLVLPPRGGVLQFENGKFTPHPIATAVKGSMAAIYAEPSGVVWVGTYEGMLTRWEKGEVTTFGAADGLGRRGVGDGVGRRGLGFFFAADGSGRTWIAATDFLGYYENGKLVRFPHPRGAMLQVAPARDGGLWVLAEGQLLKLANNRLEMACENPPWLALKTSVRCLLETHAGVLWIGTARQGLFRFFRGEMEPVNYPHHGIQSIVEDHEGNIWVATDGGGIGRLRPKAFQLYDQQSGLPEALSTSVCEDEAGDVWFANRAGGLVRKRGEDLQIFPYTDGKDPIFVSSVCPDRAGHLWVSATIGLYRISLENPNVLERVEPNVRNARVLFCSRAGEMWVATAGGLLGYFHEGKFIELTKAQGFLGGGINAIAEDKAGAIWCGGAAGELYCWQANTLTQIGDNDGLPASPIHALYPDPSGALWIGTLGGLLLKEQNTVHQFTRAEGVPDGMILQIQEDDHERLWLGGSTGFFQVNKRDLVALTRTPGGHVQPISHGKEEGLRGVSPTNDYQPSVWKDHQGTLWFTTYKGVLAFDPANIVPNPTPPPVMIKQVLLDDQPLDIQRAARIAPGPHQLEFSFAALSYAAPSRVRLRHQLEGIDPHWVETTSARSARYSNLAPGAYRLRVIACNSDGVWNEKGATFAFVVQPAWWQTAWFDVSSLLTFTGVVLWGARSWTQRRLRLRLDQLQRDHALEKERSRIARDLHDELGASITGIGMLVNRLKESSSTQSGVLVEQLANRTQRFASDLERVVWTVSPKNNTLDRFAVFVGQFAQNFFHGTRVVCLVRNTKDIPALDLAPDVQNHLLAVAKEALNNVQKHARASEVVLESAVAAGWFSLTIKDNGIGFVPISPEHSERNGLSNMRSRIAEIHGEIRIESTPGKGSMISLRIPIERPRRTFK
jgi:ligand-binding sensor domain-containing protein/signal transduction histidine kinase